MIRTKVIAPHAASRPHSPIAPTPSAKWTPRGTPTPASTGAATTLTSASAADKNASVHITAASVLSNLGRAPLLMTRANHRKGTRSITSDVNRWRPGERATNAAQRPVDVELL